MTRFFSRFSPLYIRSLVYMMQASEYNVFDFFLWYERVEDFSQVEKRKRLFWSVKATYLFLLLWIITALCLIFAIDILFIFPLPYNIICALLVVGATGFVPPYTLVLLAIAGQVIQKPIEWWETGRAGRRLASHKGFKIAIAGSYGKTSMREILKAVLSEGKKVAAPPGSHNTPLGVARFIRSLKGDEEVIIFELGEYYPGDVRKLCKIIKPDLGVITGVNEAHLEKFKTLAKAADTIFEISAFVAPDSLYINGENETSRDRAKERNVLYSHAGAGRFTAENIHSDLGGTSLTLVSSDVRIEAHSSLLGLHQIGPLALAAEIAARLNLSDVQIKAGIGKTKPFAHRLEPRVDQSGVVTLDDSYNGNPDGVSAVIEFLAALKARRFYVTPGLVEMGARKEAVHRDIGTRLAKANIEKVVLIRNSVTPFIEAGLKDANFAGEILWFSDMPQALSALSHMTISGDVVVIQNDWPDQYA